MILVDSSGWIEYFTVTTSSKFEKYLEGKAEIITPVIVIYEVYKKLKKHMSTEQADLAIAEMSRTHVVPVTSSIALAAADISLDHDLAMADAIVYATAIEFGCKVVTMDNDFRKLPRAEVIS